MARKILLADDSVTAQNMGRKILADAGYEVITVNNGSAALKKIGEQKPDLIVLDVYMPGYSGLEVCQRLKEVGDTSRIPILLTVGKLEPFKPEEAKRVRADGFIVKPFEASELLSALSKLEDKIVPRSESSKLGRFARAAAAIEEGRYDKTMAVADDSSGWKNRISFPSKKKEKTSEHQITTGEFYNPVNKDLKTVIGQQAPEPAPVVSGETAKAEESTVNLGAVAPEGLPKDVTPEEIAALAAAAAQIKGKALDEKPAEPIAEMPVTSPAEIVAQPENIAPPKPETRKEAPPADPAAVPEVAASAAPATFAEQEKTEKAEEPKPAGKAAPAEVMAAIAGLETEWVDLASLQCSASWGQRAEKQDEPVTMAVAKTAESEPAATSSRWSAVAAALAPEEAAISLEHEMQKAYAAFAAAESGYTEAVAEEPAESAPTTLSAPEAPIADAAPSPPSDEIPAAPAPEVAQPLAVVSVAATDAIGAAVSELHAVAAKYEQEQKISAAPPEESSQAYIAEPPAPAEQSSKAEEKFPELPIKEQIEEETQAKAGEATEAKPEAETEEKITSEKVEEILEPPAEPAREIVAASPAPVEPQAAMRDEEARHQREEEALPVTDTPEVVAKVEIPEQKSSSEQVSEAVPVSRVSTTGGVDDMGTRESETAAAWATWRKIRDTGGSKSPAESSATEEIPEDRAAMAVAAGAESKSEDVSGSFDSDPEIAGIVDGVLAEMRPKIVEEIARKLGKKR